MPTTVTSDHHSYSFARGLTAAAEVDPGETVVLQTLDCYGGQVDLDRERLSDDLVDRDRTNPATGPVYVRGAEPGDMLVASIERIETAPRGLLFGSSRDGEHRAGMPVRIEEGKAHLPGGVVWPVDTVVGVIGVAPAGEPVRNSTPGDHGGNLDTPDVKVGSVIYLPVFEEGGMFGLGDLHALQGDGEVCGQGVEISGEVTVRLQVMKGNMGKGPIIRARPHWAIVASAEDLDEAVDIALIRARDFVMARTGVRDHEAIMLISTLCDVRISQIVNPLKTVRVCVPHKLAGTL